MPDQEFKILITADATSAVQATQQTGDSLRKLKVDTSDVGDETKLAKDATQKLGDATKDTGKKMEDAGEAASNSRGKYRALREIIGQLNQISPGLGAALELVSEAYIGAGEAATEGAVGVERFNVALEEVLTTLGPLIIVMLGIKAVMEYWELYQEKVKQAAEITSDALQKTVDSYHEVRKAIDEVEKARHAGDPNAVKQIEDRAKAREDVVNERVAGTKEVQKIQEDQELAQATTPEDKARIKKKYETYGQRYDATADEMRQDVSKTELGEALGARTLAQSQAAAIEKQIAGLGINGDPAVRASLAAQLEPFAKNIEGLSELISSLQIKNTGASDVSQIKGSNAAAAEAQRVQGDSTVAEGVAAISANAAGDHSKKTAVAINALRASYTTINGNVDGLLAAIKYGHDHALNQQQEVGLIKRQLMVLAQKIQNMPLIHQ